MNHKSNTTNFLIPISSVKDILNIQTQMLNDFSASVNKQKIPFVTTGMIDFDFEKNENNYGYFYNVPFKDMASSDVIFLDIPKSLVQRYRLTGGETVSIIGYLQINVFNNQFTARFLVVGIDLDTTNQVLSRSNRSFAEFFKHLNIERQPFPLCKKLSIAVITPQNGDAFSDMTKQIEPYLFTLYIKQYPTGIIYKDQILQTLNQISQCNYNVVIIIRGGGASNEFNVFDDIDICEAFASLKCHKIIGLGHSSNRTLLELVSDNAFQTPTAVGSYISSNLNNQKLITEEMQDKLKKKIKDRQDIIYLLSFLLVISILVLVYLVKK